MPRRPHDLLIRSGLVVDGTGAPAFRADVAIADGRIASVGDLGGDEASRVIDAGALVVSPGFIDIHTHSDITLTINPGQASSVAQGVTTQVTGNCGFSPGLAQDTAVFEFEKRWLEPFNGRITWSTFAEWMRAVEDAGPASNVVPLVGHGTLRKRIVGMERRAPSDAEKTAMMRTLAESLEAGAWGISTGLEYAPSSFADADEMAYLCSEAAQAGGLHATHLRNEGDTLVESVQEVMGVTERTGIALQLSHHKAEGPSNWGKVSTTLAMVDRARAAGLDVQMDQYPYPAYMTGLAIPVLPAEVLALGPEQIAAMLARPERLAQLRTDVLKAHPEWADAANWERMQVGVMRKHPELMGRTIAEIATERGAHPLDTALDLLRTAAGFISVIHFAIGEPDIATVMAHPYTAIGSDGSGTDPGGPTAGERIHPRTYGTFPRVLARYVRDLGVLPLEVAVHKMTGLPAARMGLDGRGTIAAGAVADITLFDPRTVQDEATFDEPHRLATGIHTVLVAGTAVVEDGNLTGARPGRVLRRGGLRAAA